MTFDPMATGVHSWLLQDHLLVPGASWSRLKKGDEVLLTGRLASGWLRCVAHREVSATVDGEGSVSVTSQLSEASSDSGLFSSNRECLLLHRLHAGLQYLFCAGHSAASDALAEAPSPTEGLAAPATSGEEAEMFVSDSLTPEHTVRDLPVHGQFYTVYIHDIMLGCCMHMYIYMYIPETARLLWAHVFLC